MTFAESKTERLLNKHVYQNFKLHMTYASICKISLQIETRRTTNSENAQLEVEQRRMLGYYSNSTDDDLSVKTSNTYSTRIWHSHHKQPSLFAIIPSYETFS